METEQELLDQKESARQALIQDYQDTFATPQGKRTLESLKLVCHFMDVMDCDDPLILSKWTGERNVIIHILKALNRNPDKVRQTKAEVNQQPTEEIEGAE